MHVAVVGVGNVGRSIAYRLLLSNIPEELSLVDTKEGLARAIGEEFKHAASGIGVNTVINCFDHDEDLSGADIIVISAGYPRPQGIRISRRDLLGKNADIIKLLAEVLPSRNPGAKYVIVTNPVDANAMLFKRISKAEFVISTGDHLETLRFRSRLSEVLQLPRKYVSGYVGGEHGEEAVPLWSTVVVEGKPLKEYLQEKNVTLNKGEVENYIKEVPEVIIDYAGATRYGPAEAFTALIRAIALNENKVFSIATPLKIPGVASEVFVSVPTILGSEIRDRLLHWLSEEEMRRVARAANAVYRTYSEAVRLLGLE